MTVEIILLPFIMLVMFFTYLGIRTKNPVFFIITLPFFVYLMLNVGGSLLLIVFAIGGLLGEILLALQVANND